MRLEMRVSNKRWRAMAAALGAAAFLGVSPAATQAAGQGDLPDGAGLYRVHCAACHGNDAHGRGPMASAMRTPPPDLTLLAKNNGGTFPLARVRRIVDGREVESHGSRDMPVWGDVFKTTRLGFAGDPPARITAIVSYLETLQQRNAQ